MPEKESYGTYCQNVLIRALGYSNQSNPTTKINKKKK